MLNYDFNFGEGFQKYYDPSYFGIYPVKVTGKQDPDFPQYIEVVTAQEVVAYARPLYTFPIIAAPSSEWLSKYKNDVLLWVINAYGNPNAIMWLGFTFLDGKEPASDFPREYLVLGEKFVVRTNDKTNSYAVEQVNPSGDVVQAIGLKDDYSYIRSKSVNLGSENASEPALLGNRSVQLLGELIDALCQLTFTNGGGVTGIPNNVAQLQNIRARLDQLKSPIVKLD